MSINAHIVFEAWLNFDGSTWWFNDKAVSYREKETKSGLFHTAVTYALHYIFRSIEHISLKLIVPCYTDII